jgi:glutathione peroxidase
MASLPFSCSSVPGLKIHPNRTTMASFVTSIKSSLGPSKSAFLQRGFSLQSPNLPGFASKARSFGVFARAATEKSVHDFTVKVVALLIKLFVFLQYWFNCSVYHLFESWKLGFVLISLA